MNTWWLVSVEWIDYRDNGGDVGGRIEAPFAAQAAKKLAERGGRGHAVIRNEQTGELFSFTLHAITLHYAYPA